MIDYSLPVTWREGDRHHVGKVAVVRYSPTMTGHVKDERPADRDDCITVFVRRILIRHSHTGELEFVATEKLSNYPTEPIPTP